jgi:hypothetical protein
MPLRGDKDAPDFALRSINRTDSISLWIAFHTGHIDKPYSHKQVCFRLPTKRSQKRSLRLYKSHSFRQKICLLSGSCSFLTGLLFNLEDESYVFFQNVCRLPWAITALYEHIGRKNSSQMTWFTKSVKGQKLHCAVFKGEYMYHNEVVITVHYIGHL